MTTDVVQGGPGDAPVSPERRARRVRLSIWLYIAALAVAGGALAAPVLLAGPGPVAPHRLSPLAVLACYLVFEHGMLAMDVRRRPDDTQTLTFTEMPLVLGLLFLSPVELVVAGTAAPLLANLCRRQDAVKQVFNTVNRLLDLAVALTVYHLLVPDDPHSTGGWAAICLAASASGLSASSGVAGVIRLSAGAMPWRQLRAMVLPSPLVAAVSGTLGLVVALAIQQGSAAGPLLVCLCVALAGLRAFAQLTDRHTDLVSFHDWSRRLSSATDVAGVLSGALEASGALLLAKDVTLVLTDLDGQGGLLVRRGQDGRPRRRTVGADEVPVALGVTDSGRSVVAATTVEGERRVILVAADRSSHRRFDDEDARLLDMVVDKVGLALRNGHLIDQLRYDALHDSLTALANRTCLAQQCAQRDDAPGGTQVLWLGLHDFEVVNEALGYDSGDLLLVQLADRLRAATPDGAVVARVDGDEFAVLLPADTTCAEAAALAERLAACIAEPYEVAGVPVVVRASVGLSGMATADAVAASGLLRRADTAMRAARRSGSRVQHYTPDLETSTADRLGLVVDLQTGIPRGELRLYVQPQVSLRDGTVLGVEALVRWEHPTRGLIPPGLFVPLAEQTGLDEPLTQWVLDAALRAAGQWRAAGRRLTVAVNVPPRALGDGRLRETVASALRTHGVPGEDLVLEITEGSLLENPTAAAEVLRDLTALGIKVSVDDFGTGFSSLSHLKRLPVDEIKIDRSFVSSMLQDADDAAIVRSVVELAKNLGLSCVAEGVEDEATYEALRRLGCDIAQGYLLAAPMPVAALPGWVDDRMMELAARHVPAPRRRSAAPAGIGVEAAC